MGRLAMLGGIHTNLPKRPLILIESRGLAYARHQSCCPAVFVLIRNRQVGAAGRVFRNGWFRLLEGVSQAGMPVYRRESVILSVGDMFEMRTEYLYYWGEREAWALGADYHTLQDDALFTSQYREAAPCPAMATGWRTLEEPSPLAHLIVVVSHDDRQCDEAAIGAEIWQGITALRNASEATISMNWKTAFWEPDTFGRFESVAELIQLAARLGLEVALATGAASSFLTFADYYRHIATAKYVLAPSVSWQSPGQVIVDAQIMRTVVFSRPHRLMNRLLSPSFYRIDSVYEAMLKIAYLEEHPIHYAALVEEAHNMAFEFVDKQSAPNLLGIEARAMSSTETMEARCMLPLSASSRNALGQAGEETSWPAKSLLVAGQIRELV